MKIKGVIEEDFQDYKQTSFYIAFPTCTFKCEKAVKKFCCSNRELFNSPDIDIDPINLVERYLRNTRTEAIVIAGLEPFDSFDNLFKLIACFRKHTQDDIVIYTGYNPSEIAEEVEQLKLFQNIVIKFGRFVPNSKSKFDNILGVELASENQYAIKIS